MAFIKLAAILCDHPQCTRHAEDPIPETQTLDWPTKFDPSYLRHLQASGWFIDRHHTLCPAHGAELVAAAKADAEQRAAVEAIHEPLFALGVAG